MRIRRVLMIALLTGVMFTGVASAATISYTIEDIMDFAGYTNGTTAASWTGTGFVGMYQSEFGHLFGIEDYDFSRTALNVDVTALAGATINSAYLTFDLLDGSAGAHSVAVTSFDANGTLGHFWTPPTNEGSATYTVQGQASNSIDVTAMLQNRVGAGEDWFGLHLQGVDNVYEWTWTYTGYGDTADEARVRLVVDYDPVPEPASMTLLGLGLAGFAVRRLRRRS